MTLEEYEKIREEKRKQLAKTSTERKVEVDKELAKMVVKKKEDEEFFVKLVRTTICCCCSSSSYTTLHSVLCSLYPVLCTLYNSAFCTLHSLFLLVWLCASPHSHLQCCS